MTGARRPGGKARSWSPCRSKTPSGTLRCDRCWNDLVAHPDAGIRAAVAREPDAPRDVLETLAGDLDITVAHAATEALHGGRR